MQHHLSRANVQSSPLLASELQPGMGVVCARPSFLQDWGARVDDPWRHICIVVANRDERVGAAHIFDDPQDARAAAAWALARVGQDDRYS